MTKNDMALKITEDLKGSVQLQVVKEIMQRTFDEVINVLATEKRLELRNFGVFEVRERKARKARNPKTGEGVMIEKHNAVSFHAGKIMLDRVDGKIKTHRLNNATNSDTANSEPPHSQN